MDPIVVTTLDDGLAIPGERSLRTALAVAEDGDIITFEEGLSGTIFLTDGERLLIDTAVKIYGDGDITISGDVAMDDIDDNGVTRLQQTIDAGRMSDNVQVFYITTNDEVTLDGLTISGGRGADGDYSGAIDAFNSNLTISNSTISGNISYGADGNGGGAVWTSGSLTIEDSTLSYNQALNDHGGAIFASGLDTTATITDSRIHDNSADLNGGGIFAQGAAIIATNSQIFENSASGSGGGIAAADAASSVTLTGVQLGANVAEGGSGGGIDAEGAVILTDTTLNANRALGFLGSPGGGGIRSESSLTATNVTIVNNYAGNAGGDTFVGVGGGISAAG
ncbi:MAG: right-handed parallel beta-helix repeat-containing protein, partial [Pseudomonadota bacterium]